MPDLQWDIGPIKVTRVEERVAPVSWDRLVPDGAAHVQDLRPWIDPYVSGSGNHLLLSVHSFIVQTPETLIVVDTCVGTGSPKPMLGDAEFGARLDHALPGGINAVDTVVCTHLHFDHVGWNTIERDGVRVPTFPNATYLVSDAELNAMRDAEDTVPYEESIAPLLTAGCLQRVDANHQIDEWVQLVGTPGHTPGHVSVLIGDGEAAGLITGDIIHTPLQFSHPSASSLPDADPAEAIGTRQRILQEYVGSDVLILGSHFTPPTAGHLRQGQSGVWFQS